MVCDHSFRGFARARGRGKSHRSTDRCRTKSGQESGVVECVLALSLFFSKLELTQVLVYVFAIAILAHCTSLLQVIEAGMRGWVGKVNMDRNSPEFYIEDTSQSLEDTRTFVGKTLERVSVENDQHGAYRRVLPAITPRFTPTCTYELMKGEEGGKGEKGRTSRSRDDKAPCLSFHRRKSLIRDAPTNKHKSVPLGFICRLERNRARVWKG